MHLEKTELDSLVMSTIYIPIVFPYNLFYMVKIVAKTWTPSALFHFFQQHSPLLSEAPRGLCQGQAPYIIAAPATWGGAIGDQGTRWCAQFLSQGDGFKTPMSLGFIVDIDEL